MNCNNLHKLTCIHDMTNFYTQYKTIDPYLKRKTPKIMNIFNLQKIQDYLMVFMNVYYVHAVQHHFLLIGGIQIDIFVQLWDIDGLQILEMNILMKNQRNQLKMSRLKIVIKWNVYICPKRIKSMNHLMKLIEEYKERKIASATL